MNFVIIKKAKIALITSLVILLLWTPCSIAAFSAVVEYQTNSTSRAACIHHNILNQADASIQVQSPDQEASSTLCSFHCSASYISQFHLQANAASLFQGPPFFRESNFYQITHPLNYRPPKLFSI